MPRRVITRSIPAGMRINVVEDLRAELKDLETSGKKIMGDSASSGGGSDPDMRVLEKPDVLSNMTPPRTICKNKRLVGEDDSFEFIDEHSKVGQDYKRELNIDNNTSICKPNGTDSGNNEDKSLPLKDRILNRLQKSNNSNKVQTIMDSNLSMSSHSSPVELSVKDRIAKRLQKNLEKKRMNTSKENTNTESPESRGNKDCTCTSCDKFINCPIWCSHNIEFGDSESGVAKKSQSLLQENPTLNPPHIMMILSNKIIIHGVVIPKPVLSLDNTFLDKDVQKSLEAMNRSSVKEIQSHMLPAVQRGLNMFMIGPSGIGKTLAYLPTLCTFTIDKNEKYLDLLTYQGPFVVILCLDNQSCGNLHNLIKTFNARHSFVVEVATDGSVAQDNNCDILITTPSALEKCLLCETIKLQRLCHLAIENAHAILKKHNQSMGILFNIMNKLQTNRPHNKNIQIVISSEKWSLDMEALLKKLKATPLVCFEDFLEAAVYSRTNFKKKNIKSVHKLFYLVDILKTNFMANKTVVFCRNNEINDVGRQLEINGVGCITVSDSLTKEEIFQNEDLWCSLRSGSFKVLLVSDASFEKILHVRDAHWLVHLHLPEDWSQFSRRFRCLSANFRSPLCLDESGAHSLYSFLVIDELCDDRLVGFFGSLH